MKSTIKLTVGFTLTIVFIIGCKRSEDKSDFVVNPEKEIKFSEVQLEDFDLQLPKMYRYSQGFAKVFGDSIYYVDQAYNMVHVFDKSGKFFKSHLNFGEGPKEISKVDGFTKNDSFYIVVMTPLFLVKAYDKNWNYVFQSKLVPLEGYESDAYFNNPVLSLGSRKIALPITKTTQEYNLYTSDLYYSNNTTYGVYDLTRQMMITPFAERSKVFLDYKYIPHHVYMYGTQDDSLMYIGQEPDSLISVYRKSDLSLVKKFGYKGKNMVTNYITTNSVKESDKYLVQSRVENGYYTNLTRIENRDLLFRCYRKGMKYKFGIGIQENPMGLQVYKGNTLIADVDIPLDFNLVGYIEPYFYAQGIISEKNNSSKFYRFKIEY